MNFKFSALSMAIALIATCISCIKPCTKELWVGEQVLIPVTFSGFSYPEIEEIRVYRVDNTNSIDSFLLRDILWNGQKNSNNVYITDKPMGNERDQYGYYDSYLNNCKLILDWYTGKDSLLNFVIEKSQEQIKGCHKGDPNIKIDELSFVHDGGTIHRNESIEIQK